MGMRYQEENMGGVTAACFDEYDVVDALLLKQCFNVTLVESPYVEDEEVVACCWLAPPAVFL